VSKVSCVPLQTRALSYENCAEEEFERRLAVGRVAINLVVDTLLSALVEEQIAPQGGSDYIAKAIVGIYVSVRFLCRLRRRLLCTFRSSRIAYTTTVWKRTVVEFIVEVAQAQKLEFVRSRLETCKADYLHHWS
jgi:hypothetical protein